MRSKRVKFPRAVRAPTPATLRITDGRHGKKNALVVNNRAFLLTIEEARATPDVVTGMYSYLFIVVSLFTLIFVHDVIRVVPIKWYVCSCHFFIRVLLDHLCLFPLARSSMSFRGC